MVYPPVLCYITLEHGPVEIVKFPMKHGGSFHSYVTQPEGWCFGFASDRTIGSAGLDVLFN